MAKAYYSSRREGHIPGLRLPQSVWVALRAQGIMHIDWLRAVADQLHLLPGIGRKSAQLVREELVRIAAPEKQSPSR
ncbi:hypothetical protein AA309_20845 [Microvirga vignae]|uniref:Helix-hairpin-helix domain-containing protein n=1 Tax=Microvirga vignae TaxID=1225564 RepID=A0A0H1R7X6_9HYPH|nr:hypothetical protein AA309_20845 [Microvirga vignae]